MAQWPNDPMAQWPNSSLPDPAVPIEIRADALLEPLDDGPQELLRASQVVLEPLDALFERRGSIALRRDLTLLVEVPEQSHTSAV